MMRRLSLLLCFAPLLASAQEAGDSTVLRSPRSTCAASLCLPTQPDTTLNKHRHIGFRPYGIVPHKLDDADRWKNIPEECRIDWWRKRKNFLPEIIDDISVFFNTYDTTYVKRNHYDFMLMGNNVNFFQHIRLSAFNDKGVHQVITMAPARAIKIGPYGGWRWLTVGYTFGIVPDRYKSHASEFNIAAYNSKLGFDLNYIHSRGNFNLLNASGFEGIDRHSLRGRRVEAMRSNTFALNLYYVFNYRHFSYPAAFSMSTVQLKSAGSWMAGVRYDRQSLHFDSDKTEALLQTITPTARLIDEMRVSSILYRQVGFSMGYAYNWVPAGGWLFSVSAAPSIGYKYQEGEGLNTSTLWKNIENFHVDVIFRGGVVWTTGRYYVGCSTVNYFYDYRHKGFVLNNSIHYLRFYLGFYFKRQKTPWGTRQSQRPATFLPADAPKSSSSVSSFHDRQDNKSIPLL